MTAERIQKNKVPSWLGSMVRGAGCKGQGATNNQTCPSID